MQASNISHDDSIIAFEAYFNNNYNRNILPLTFVLMFFVLFHFIYLIIDSFIDKNNEKKLAQFICAKSLQKENKKIAKQEKIIENINGDACCIAEEEVEEQQQQSEKDTKENLHKEILKTENVIWSNRNLQISFIHSLLCSIWLTRIALCENHIFNNLFGHMSWDTYLVVAFSSGYFLYDFYDICINGHFHDQWVVCVHHLIVIVCFSHNLIHLLNIGYTAVALAMEYNSIFLHARKLLKFYYGDKSDNNPIAIVNKYINLLTFVFFRFGILYLIFDGIMKDGDKVYLGYLILLSSCTFAMSIINVVLLKRLIVSDFFPKTTSSTDDSININDYKHLSIKNTNLVYKNNGNNNEIDAEGEGENTAELANDKFYDSKKNS
jgi:hypothetical protein